MVRDTTEIDANRRDDVLRRMLNTSNPAKPKPGQPKPAPAAPASEGKPEPTGEAS
jgi:hypothetical protein